MTLSAGLPRAGQLDCACTLASGDGEVDRRGTVLLAAAFALSVLSQVLILGILPLAGLSLAPSRAGAALPYAAFYAGAAIAGLPASLLLDAIGRRAAFSLGASLGIAGGLVLVWALTQWHFGALILGAFWLGVAGGFSLFYRHAAAGLGGGSPRALLLVFGAATLAGFAAPGIADYAEALATPRVFVGMGAAAALAHVGSLTATAALPYRPQHSILAAEGPRKPWREILLPTSIGAAAWFLMTALMGATPIAMVGCGLTSAVSGVVAWHVVAMYAPSLALAGMPAAIRPSWIVCGGGLALTAGALVFAVSSSAAQFSLSAALVGIGWSLATLGTTLWVHRDREPSRWALGLHDACLLAAALLGALATGIIA
ncbi:hypothetical protein [Microvirga sp. 17 mud 1-3]|uniref:hypothetical protein n=1 Tax=Microvirga sp. 17 mud 1-3 TaxID=2082949 RepID=UPI000D6CBD68|nr:hypothetical protein [Microvirga sp. 17 mud 1-3]AWM86585.1 hypothetical protein C4E04_07485 [Microvirga sp. 17 mud 1-3]